MDEFKKYLQQHRDEMDTDAPPAYLLQRIQQQTAKKPKATIYSILFRGAVAACTIAIVVVAIKWMTKEVDKKPADTIAINIPAPINTATDTLAASVNKITAANESAKIHKEDRAVLNKKTMPKKESISYQLMHSFEHNYTQLVNLQLKSIRTTPVYGETEDYFNAFKSSLRQIDFNEAIIKKNIKTAGLNDQLLEQLINVYQEKINVLRNLQHEMNNMNNKVKENQLPSDSLKTHYINI
jgi:hypothetical protein